MLKRTVACLCILAAFAASLAAANAQEPREPPQKPPRSKGPVDPDNPGGAQYHSGDAQYRIDNLRPTAAAADVSNKTGGAKRRAAKKK